MGCKNSIHSNENDIIKIRTLDSIRKEHEKTPSGNFCSNKKSSKIMVEENIDNGEMMF